MVVNRNMLRIMFSSLLFLAKQGPTFQHYENEKGNYLQLLHLRSTNVSQLKHWLSRSTNWTSHEVMNEQLNLLSRQVLSNIVQKVKENYYFAILMDETRDMSHQEQVSICIWTVNQNLEVYEFFIGLYQVSITDAETIVKVATDILQRLDLKFHQLRFQCFDGASNMREFTKVSRHLLKILKDVLCLFTAMHIL